MLWWRRSVVAVTAIALAVMMLHDLLFGWVTRCGAGLPLAFVLAYLGAVALERGRLDRRCGLVTLLTAAVLVRDATTGLDVIALAFPIVLIVFGIGRAVRHRTAMSAELQARRASSSSCGTSGSRSRSPTTGPGSPTSSTDSCRNGSTS